LFVAPYAPNPIRTRSLNLIKGLAALGSRVTLATLWSNTSELEFLHQLSGILDGLIMNRIGSIHSGWNCVRALAGSLPIQARYSWSSELMKKISRAIETTDFDVVHVEHLRGAMYAMYINSAKLAAGRKLPVVWDSVDCISDLFRQASQGSSSRRVRMTARVELPRTERLEGWLTTQVARTVVTSETDRQGLLALAEMCCRKNGHISRGFLKERLDVIPNGVDLEYFCPNGSPREPQTLVISGKMSYHANVTSVLAFVREIMPKIWVRFPRTCLWIVGKDPSPEIRSLGIPARAIQTSGMPRKENGDDRIRITGTVEDIRPYLRKATLAVAPIRYGVGIQNKVLEAMACGTPVVATPDAVRGLHVRFNHHLAVANGEHSLADSICSLFANPVRCSDLGHAGRAFVEANHNWHHAVRRLTQVYENAGS
jgi:glycosyltransferase involved in cell wall biosynthesis